MRLKISKTEQRTEARMFLNRVSGDQTCAVIFGFKARGGLHSAGVSEWFRQTQFQFRVVSKLVWEAIGLPVEKFSSHAFKDSGNFFCSCQWYGV